MQLGESWETVATYSSLVDSLPHPIVILSPEFRVLKANRAFCEGFSVSGDEAVDCLAFDLHTGQWRDLALEQALAAVAAGEKEHAHVELDLDLVDLGRRTLSIAVQLLAASGGLLMLSVSDATSEQRVKQGQVDEVCCGASSLRTTARKNSTRSLVQHDTRANLEGIVEAQQGELEEALEHSLAQNDARADLEGIVEAQQGELEEARERASAAERLESIGLLAGGVAHDFNNMLSAILGYSEIVLEKLTEQNDVRRMVKAIQTAGEASAVLVGQLLAVGRKQFLEPKVTDLNEVLESTRDLLYAGLSEDVEILIKPGLGLGKTRVDPNRIQQAVMNLALNARDAMPLGGRVTIETCNASLDKDEAQTHPEAESGEYVVLAVSDSGTGMDRKTLARAFDPFFTTKSQANGTGLGLSSVHGFVKQSGGWIWAHSELGVGTVFKIYLPRVDDEAVSQPARMRQRRPLPGAETILLAEDNQLVRELATEVLEGGGYRVLVAGNGFEALEIAECHEGEIHLAITDVVMPGLGGKGLAEKLRPLYPEIAILFTSGYGEDSVVDHGALDEGLSFLAKPLSPRTLLARVRQMLAN